MELKIPKEWLDEAVQRAVEEIKQNYVHKSVIEDIRAEIKLKCDYFDENINRGIAKGFYRALDIIDRHMKGVNE